MGGNGEKEKEATLFWEDRKQGERKCKNRINCSQNQSVVQLKYWLGTREDNGRRGNCVCLSEYVHIRGSLRKGCA